MPHLSHTEAVVAIMKDAASAIMRIYSSGSYKVSHKADSSPVTRADIESEKIIKYGLAMLTPGIPVISEESVSDPLAPDRLPNDYWIVDPIDGTKEFLKGNDEFCICIARISAGIVNEGYIYSPPSGILWYAQRGKGAFRVSAGISGKLPCTGAIGAFRILRSRSHSTAEEDRWISLLAGSMEIVQEQQGSAVKFGRLADGSGDIYIKLSKIYRWDVAAGLLLVEESGGRVYSLSTRDRLSLGSPGYTVDPFIATGYRVTGIDRIISSLPPF